MQGKTIGEMYGTAQIWRKKAENSDMDMDMDEMDRWAQTSYGHGQDMLSKMPSVQGSICHRKLFYAGNDVLYLKSNGNEWIELHIQKIEI